MKNKSNKEIKPVTRREFLLKASSLAGVSAASGYLAFAPEQWPLSLNDPKGIRSIPEPRLVQLPDFRVVNDPGFAQVGVGSGGPVDVVLRKALDAIGGLKRFIQPGDVVLIKPNAAFDRSPFLGATTHPDTIATLVRMVLVECGAAEVKVTDNPIESPAACFQKNGIRQAVEQAGGRIFLPDRNSFQSLATPKAVLIKEWEFLYRPFAKVNKVIGLAPVKDHNLCGASLGIKNWYGLLGGKRNQFHQDIHEIVSDLSLMIKPTLTILDGMRVLMRNGPTGGNPADVIKQGKIAAGTDPVALDTWAYQNLLQRQSQLPAYLEMAENKGTGTTDYRNSLKEMI